MGGDVGLASLYAIGKQKDGVVGSKEMFFKEDLTFCFEEEFGERRMWVNKEAVDAGGLEKKKFEIVGMRGLCGKEKFGDSAVAANCDLGEMVMWIDFE